MVGRICEKKNNNNVTQKIKYVSTTILLLRTSNKPHPPILSEIGYTYLMIPAPGLIFGIYSIHFFHISKHYHKL